MSTRSKLYHHDEPAERNKVLAAIIPDEFCITHSPAGFLALFIAYFNEREVELGFEKTPQTTLRRHMERAVQTRAKIIRHETSAQASVRTRNKTFDDVKDRIY